MSIIQVGISFTIQHCQRRKITFGFYFLATTRAWKNWLGKIWNLLEGLVVDSFDWACDNATIPFTFGEWMYGCMETSTAHAIQTVSPPHPSSSWPLILKFVIVNVLWYSLQCPPLFGAAFYFNLVGQYTIVCVYGDLVWAEVYTPRQWFDMCVDASIYRGVLLRDKTVYFLQSGRGTIAQANMAACAEETSKDIRWYPLAPLAHYWQLIGFIDMIIGVLMLVGACIAFWITIGLGACVCVAGCTLGSR